MRKSVTVSVTTVAGTEVLSDALTGLADRKRTIRNINFEQAGDNRLRVYLDQERIVDASADCNQYDFQPVEVNCDLATGRTLKVGFQSDGADAAARRITVEYDEE